MKSVVFTFHDHASEENQDRLRTKILELAGVHNVGRISPQAKKPALRRHWYAQVADDQAAGNLIAWLRDHEDVRSAELPAERNLT